MALIRLTFVLMAALVTGANAQAPVKPLEALLAHVPGAQVSDGRGALDRSAAKGEGPLAPAGLLVSAPMVLIGTTTLQAQDAGELIHWMKAKGRAVRIAHTGPWSASLECALQMQDLLETKLTLVATAHAADALGKLKSGAVDVLCEAVPSVIEDVRRGDVIAFVLAADERLPALWDVATADQAGLPLFSATAWLGLYAASGQGPTNISKSMTDEAVQTLADVGWSLFAPSYQTADAHKQHLAAEDERRRMRLNLDGLPATQ